jgi:hypothetical protein
VLQPENLVAYWAMQRLFCCRFYGEDGVLLDLKAGFILLAIPVTMKLCSS